MGSPKARRHSTNNANKNNWVVNVGKQGVKQLSKTNKIKERKHIVELPQNDGWTTSPLCWTGIWDKSQEFGRDHRILIFFFF